MWIDALAPDRCRSDPCAVCAYYHLKLAALNGGRDQLSQRDLEFVGVGVLRRRNTSGGWRSLGGGNVYENDGLSEEDNATLHSLMAIESVDLNRERLEFLA